MTTELIAQMSVTRLRRLSQGLYQRLSGMKTSCVAGIGGDIGFVDEVHPRQGKVTRIYFP